MPAAGRKRILDRFRHLPDVEFLDFEPDPMRRLAATDVVVSMAGYNTVCEALAAGVPAVLVPRCEPVQEQLLRARRLHELGCADLVEPKELEPRRLLDTVLEVLARPWRPACPFPLDGLAGVQARAGALLTQAAPLATSCPTGASS
jgi:predicted glycosyltransferase